MAIRCARVASMRISVTLSMTQNKLYTVFVVSVIAQELLTALLMQSVKNLGPTEANSLETCDITVADILGPKRGIEAGDEVNSRDANFSLLSYSFSLV